MCDWKIGIDLALDQSTNKKCESFKKTSCVCKDGHLQFQVLHPELDLLALLLFFLVFHIAFRACVNVANGFIAMNPRDRTI